MKAKGKNISFIESVFEGEEALGAEFLIERSALSGGYQSGRKMWEYITQDRSFHFQQELKLRNDIVEDYRCNCNDFGQSEFCQHLAAVMLAVRKELNSTTKNEEATVTRRSRSQIRNLTTFLQQVNEDELGEFVKDHARGDNWFRQKLFARFYEKMTKSEKELFVESLFPVLTKANEKIPLKRVTQFVRITEELTAQFNTYISEDDYLEAYSLIFNLLKKSYYIKHHLKNEHTTFNQNHDRIVKNLLEIVRLIEAPEFKTKVIGDLIELVASSYITIHSKYEKEVWLYLYQNSSNPDLFLKAIEEKLSQGIKDYSSYYFLRSIQLILLKDRKRQQAISRLTNQDIYRIVQHLILLNKVEASRAVLKEIIKSSKLNHTLIKQILRALTVPVDQLTYQKIFECFVPYKDRFILEWLKRDEKQWKENRFHFEGHLSEMQDPYPFIEFLCAESRYQEAYEKLRDSLGYKVPIPHDEEFQREDPELLTKLYLKLVDDYLSVHFGTGARNFLSSVNSRLRMLQANQASSEVKKLVKAQFASRKIDG